MEVLTTFHLDMPLPRAWCPSALMARAEQREKKELRMLESPERVVRFSSHS